MDAPEWRAAGARTRLLFFDGSILAPFVLVLVWFSWITICAFVIYAVVNAYIVYKGRSMVYFIDRWRFWLRGGVVAARPANYWRKLMASSARS